MSTFPNGKPRILRNKKTHLPTTVDIVQSEYAARHGTLRLSLSNWLKSCERQANSYMHTPAERIPYIPCNVYLTE